MIIEILGVVMENLENAILDVGKNAFQKKKLEKDFLESAAFIAALNCLTLLMNWCGVMK